VIIAYRTRGSWARAMMRTDVVLQVRLAHKRHSAAGDRTRKRALARVRLVVSLQVALSSGRVATCTGMQNKSGQRKQVRRFATMEESNVRGVTERS
jgi:hypothetical protein